MRFNSVQLTLIKKIAVAISIAISTSVISGCDSESIVEKTLPSATIRPALTEVISPIANKQLTFNGVVRSAERADLAFRVGGHLTNIYVDQGQHVKKNQLLAQLDARDAETSLESATAEYKNSKTEYLRGKSIFEKSQAISKSSLDTLTTRYQLAKNGLNEARRQLEYTKLYAPFDGVIGRKMVDNHVQIQANEPIFTIHDINDLEI